MKLKKHLNEFVTKQIKSLNHDDNGILVNHKVLIDNDGILWNHLDNINPYKIIPLYYFNLRDELLANIV